MALDRGALAKIGMRIFARRERSCGHDAAPVIDLGVRAKAIRPGNTPGTPMLVVSPWRAYSGDVKGGEAP